MNRWMAQIRGNGWPRSSTVNPCIERRKRSASRESQTLVEGRDLLDANELTYAFVDLVHGGLGVVRIFPRIAEIEAAGSDGGVPRPNWAFQTVRAHYAVRRRSVHTGINR